MTCPNFKVIFVEDPSEIWEQYYKWKDKNGNNLQ